MSERKTGHCPICNGTGRIIADNVPYAWVIAGYDLESNTLPCRNCGGQTMGCVATGYVTLRPDGTPCTHEYAGTEIGRSYWRYTCRHCGDAYSIDSSD